MSKLTLPSGASFEMNLAPFTEANNLNKAVAEELRKIRINGEMDFSDPNFIKDLACAAIASDKIIDCAWICLKRCLIDNAKITQAYFEDKREDYIPVMKEVIIGNVSPFFKGLLSH